MSRTVILVSDLHLGGGPSDPLDDLVQGGMPFVDLLNELIASPEGQRGELELIINGDFMEFVQVLPEVFTPPASDLWCTVEESKAKLEAILSGHPKIFDGLARLQATGEGERRNKVTIAAGNHDVDFYWPEVQNRIREVAGPVEFELRSEWYERFDGRLQINHGHHYDPANSFENWDEPFRFESGTRLEMCPGTLFVVSFVNQLEERFPFADNVRPVGRLISLLRKEDRSSFRAVAWLLAGFMLRHSGAMLGVSADGEGLDEMHVADTIQFDDDYAGQVLEKAQAHLPDRGLSDLPTLRGAIPDEESARHLFLDLLAAGGLDALPPLPEAGDNLLSANNEDSELLGVLKAGKIDNLQLMRDQATERAFEKDKAEVLVIGHTHLPDEYHDPEDGRWVYYNTGTWIRFLVLGKEQDVTLDELADEDSFPFELYYVKVWEEGDKLRSERVLFREQK